MDIDWKALFLSAKGRITRKTYWIGWGAQFVISLLLSMVLRPLSLYLGVALNLALLFPMYCIYAKRLQDMGKPGTLAIAPLAATIINAALSLYMVAVLGIKPGLRPMAGLNTEDMIGQMGTIMALGGVSLFLSIIGLVFWLWLGIGQGEEGPNAYGPDPRAEDVEVF